MSSAGVRVASQGRVPVLDASSRVRMAVGTVPYWSAPLMSARRRSAAARCARASGLGHLKISKMPISARHEIAEGAAQRLRVLGGLLGLLRQPYEPFGRLDVLCAEANASHHHRDLRLQPAALDFQAVAIFSEFDRDSGGLRGA